MSVGRSHFKEQSPNLLASSVGTLHITSLPRHQELVPVLTFAGIGGWQYVQTLPTKDVVILVADFEDSDPQSYRVTESIRKNLDNATESYADTKVKLLGKVIKDIAVEERVREN